MNIKARISKLSEMQWPALAALKRWMGYARSFSTFQGDVFANPDLRVAEATVNGEPVGFVPVENVLLINAYALHPALLQDDPDTAQKCQQIGEQLDDEVTKFAQSQGITEVLVMIPANHPGAQLEGFETVCVCRRKVPSKVAEYAVDCTRLTSE